MKIRIEPLIYLLDTNKQPVAVFKLDDKPMTEKKYKEWSARVLTGTLNIQMAKREIEING